MLTQGTIVDRYGFSDKSEFLAVEGTPKWARSLPPESQAKPLYRFQVMEEIIRKDGLHHGMGKPAVEHSTNFKIARQLKHLRLKGRLYN